MRVLANLLGYQAVWWAAVLGAARGWAWPGLAAAAAFVLAQLAASAHRRVDLALLAVALPCGLLLDGALATTGVLRYAAPAAALPAPLWILALWAAFVLTVNHALAGLQGRPWLARALGAVGGPLAYLAAARLGAVALATPAWRPLLALAAGWAVAVALLLRLARQWRRLDAVVPATGARA